jgi:predicted N-acyltransferase
VLLENLRDLGTPIHNLSYYQRVLNCFGDAANVLVISHENRPAGAMFMVVHRDTMCDPWASSLRRYFKLCANEALYWEAIQQAIRGGLRHFDFGRSQWDSGTFRFKRNWGAQPVPLYYQYILGRAGRVPTLADQQQHYALAVRLWQRLPLPMAGFLGEFVRRRFPEVL